MHFIYMHYNTPRWLNLAKCLGIFFKVLFSEEPPHLIFTPAGLKKDDGILIPLEQLSVTPVVVGLNGTHLPDPTISPMIYLYGTPYCTIEQIVQSFFAIYTHNSQGDKRPIGVDEQRLSLMLSAPERFYGWAKSVDGCLDATSETILSEERLELFTAILHQLHTNLQKLKILHDTK